MFAPEPALKEGGEAVGAAQGTSTPTPQQFRAQVYARKRANRFRLGEVVRLEGGDFAKVSSSPDEEHMLSSASKRARLVTGQLAAGTSQLVASLRMERLQLEKAFLEMEWSHLEKVEALLEREISASQASEAPRMTDAFSLSEKAPTKTIVSQHLKLFFDGASKSNPGESGAGWFVTRGDGNTLAYGWKYLGSSSTNNEAEYAGFIEGVTFVQRHVAAFSVLEIQGDSNLVVQQVLGHWKCKSANLQPLCAKARSILDALHKKGQVKVSHIPREENGIADALSNVAVAQRSVVVNSDVKERIDLNYLRARFAV